MLQIDILSNYYCTFQDIIDNFNEDELMEMAKESLGIKNQDEVDLESITDDFQSLYYELMRENDIIYDNNSSEAIIEYESSHVHGQIIALDLLEVNDRYDVSDINAVSILDKYIEVQIEHDGYTIETAWWDIKQEMWVSLNNNIDFENMVYITKFKIFLSYKGRFYYENYTKLNVLNEETFMEQCITLFESNVNKEYINTEYTRDFDMDLIRNICKKRKIRFSKSNRGLYYDSVSEAVYLYDKCNYLFKIDIGELVLHLKAN